MNKEYVAINALDIDDVLNRDGLFKLSLPTESEDRSFSRRFSICFVLLSDKLRESCYSIWDFITKMPHVCPYLVTCTGMAHNVNR